jgi:hypothetical protein
LQVLYLSIREDTCGISFDRILHAWEGEVHEKGAFERMESLFLVEDVGLTTRGRYESMVDLGKLECWPGLTEFVVVTKRKAAWKMPKGMRTGKRTTDGSDGKGWRKDEE